MGANEAMLAKGGQALYGASVGILMLDAKFPRIFGDIGNGLTWPFPVHYRVVRGASVDNVVLRKSEGLKESFLEAAHELVADGVDGITTSCGFLSLFQSDLAKALDVPLATSSLMQAPMIQALLPPNKRVGIITVSKKTLSEEHLLGAGVPLDIPIVGTDKGKEFSRVIINSEEQLDTEKAKHDLIESALELSAEFPEVGAILLECTNMAPYANDMRLATGLPVFSIYSFILWFQSGLSPRVFQP